ncbi:helix-turn-helix domain-containing protein [Amycolatopsis sp. NPDC049688]|uniref:helix-turn-helix domain-containing protein n=1 Tax=Amycolatopsis sp. NPDC049688 TaxID=3154733 RepID=UPI0034187C4C
MNTTTSTNLSTTGSKDGSDAQDGLLTVKEACDALRVGRWTLYTFIHSGELTTVKLRRRRLVPRTAIQELIKEHQIEAIT